MEIRKADLNDIERISEIYADARRFMSENGNPDQWAGGYPPEALTRNDIAEGKLYACVDGEEIVGVFYFAKENDPTYRNIYGGEWLNNDEYAVIHRIATSAHRKGVASFCFAHCFSVHPNLKIDTHEKNIPMQRSLEKNGFVRCGTIYLENGEERIAYQKA